MAIGFHFDDIEKEFFDWYPEGCYYQPTYPSDTMKITPKSGKIYLCKQEDLKNGLPMLEDGTIVLCYE